LSPRSAWRVGRAARAFTGRRPAIRFWNAEPEETMQPSLWLIGMIAVSFASAGAATADSKLTIEEVTVVTPPDGNAPAQERRSEYTLWLRKDRAARIGAGPRMVARLDRGESYFIDDAKKKVTVIRLDELPRALEGAPQIERTGETRTIGAWNAERYDMTIELAPGQTGTFVLWVSADLDIELDAYRAYAKSVDRGEGLSTAIANLPGYPVLQETDFGIAKSTTRLIAASEEPAPAGTYDVPETYRREE
jgi:hypothetical protein